MLAKEIKNKQTRVFSLKNQKIRLGSKEGSRDNKHNIHEWKQLIDNSKITEFYPIFFKFFQEKMKIFWDLVINEHQVITTVDKSR